MTHSKRRSRKKGPVLLAGEKCVSSNRSVTVGAATMLAADVAPGGRKTLREREDVKVVRGEKGPGENGRKAEGGANG